MKERTGVNGIVKADSNHDAGRVLSVDDPQALRALSHPMRLALIDALSRQGPLTATEAGDLLDENPATCSFHFRSLAKYGFVEEAEQAKGRRRPWRLTHLGIRIAGSASDQESDELLRRVSGLMLNQSL